MLGTPILVVLGMARAWWNRGVDLSLTKVPE
jgi:hypothetical protein